MWDFRASKSNKLVGFISAVPAHIKMYEKEKAMVEINFLCVHKKLRSKRLAPVLIREITRRVNVKGRFPDLIDNFTGFFVNTTGLYHGLESIYIYKKIDSGIWF